MTHSLNLADLQYRTTDCLDALQAFLLAQPDQHVQTQAANLQKQRDELSNRVLLSLAFSGQFSAGKSTIISALTGNTEILISADVATDQVNAYAWCGIELWDTPGLYANRPDHDAKAAQALRDADLVVYCLTSNLFDDVTACDFLRLAFEQGYAGKLFLVINKLSMEDADDTDLYIKNLSASINRTLAPHQLSNFPHAFIDAQDYRDGIAVQDAELIAFSRFELFINELNLWVKEKGLLARLDPPLRLGLNIVEQSFQSLPKQKFTENPELFLINQQLRIVQNQRLRTDAEVARIGRSTVQKVQLLGEHLIAGDFGSDQESVQDALQRECDAINASAFTELNQILYDSYENLIKKLQEFANEAFVADYYAAVEVAATAVPNDDSKKRKGNPLKNVLKSVLDQGNRAVLKPGNVQRGFLYGAKEVAGGGVHKVIYAGGKFFGKKFRPWEAVRMAKGVGNAMVLLGAAIAVYEIYETVNAGIEAENQERKREQERNEFRNEIAKIGKQMSEQISNVYKSEFDQQIIEDISNCLTGARDELLAEQSVNKALVEGLAIYRKQLSQLVAELYGSAS